MKTTVMLVGLAAAVAAGTACTHLCGSDAPPPETQLETCAGLSGQAKVDCEQRQKEP